ncbi:MAG: ribosomal protein S18-alanine N-acetyltransferase [Anaerolineae bacterium]|nr:ribosomal protein S18-alanine N-acetyltransferase [Anaerolineae bacterium]
MRDVPLALPIITPLTPDDLDFIMPLERQVFRDPWTRRMYLIDLTQNNLATYLAARPAGQDNLQSGRLPPILAWGGFWLMVDEAHIATIATHPDWRGCGLGQWLMLALLDAAVGRGALTATLEVRVSNLPARTLYEKLGFQIAGYRPHYYRDGEDGLIMTTPPLAERAFQERLARAQQDALNKLKHCFGDRQ